MKRFINLFVTAILLASVSMLSSCDDDKYDQEKHDNVVVDHKYTVAGHNLKVFVHNKNKEKVSVDLFIRYNRGGSGTPLELGEVYDDLKIAADERMTKEYTLVGDMPSGIIVQYRVK